MSDPDPGMPDDEISAPRMRGRIAYRRGLRYRRTVDLPVPDGERVDFWRGYYDEQLRKVFGR